MAVGLYWSAFLALVPISLGLAGRGPISRTLRKALTGNSAATRPDAKDEEARRFRHTFLRVYLLVMGSEWLQGPYLYALLHDEKALPERTVAALYATTYAAAAASALFTGFLADRWGRRAACLAYCAVHSAACLTVLSPSLPVVFAGRMLAGSALTLLWTVFESWMVTEHAARRLEASSVPLSTMFGVMITSNCAAAIFGGAAAHCIVYTLGSRTHLFVLGIVFNTVAACLMLRGWHENYGSRGAGEDVGGGEWIQPGDAFEGEDSREAEGELAESLGRKGSITDVRIWMLGFVSCVFEGTTFLVLFLWPPMLKGGHRRTRPDDGDGVPYGIAFAVFMSAMILGALLFGKAMQKDKVGRWGRLDPVLQAGLLLTLTVAGAATTLVTIALGHAASSEEAVFYALVVFYACNGIYLPSVAYLRGCIVHDDRRVVLYSLMQIPKAALVVLFLEYVELATAVGPPRSG